MSRARSLGSFRSVLALLTLVGWVNAQAMACCWSPDAPSSAAVAGSRDAAEPDASGPMAADHSCCPGGAASASGETAAAAGSERAAASGTSSPCGGTSGVASPCCETASAALASTASVSSVCPAGTVLLTEHRLQVVPATESPLVPRLSSFSSDGSPPYLALRRLLI